MFRCSGSWTPDSLWEVNYSHSHIVKTYQVIHYRGYSLGFPWLRHFSRLMAKIKVMLKENIGLYKRQ